jgi:hypothetical protein
MATRRIRDPEAFGREAADACQRLLGRDAVEVDWPASRSRRSVRVNFADGAVIATRRRRRERSELEAYVLKTLHDHGASVPAVLAYDGVWLLQEFIDGTRLPHLLVGDDRELSRTMLSRAAEALSQIHQIGAESGLNLRVARLGATDRWLGELIDTPNRIGEVLGVAAPKLDVAMIAEVIAADIPCFVKWDARPGNAVVRKDGSVAWFDWEHCGARNALDDLAWLLGDEYVPDLDGLLDIVAANAPGQMSADAARNYFAAYATFHTSVRLALVVHHKDGGAWWDEKKCLDDDKVRVTAEGARVLCARGMEFSGVQASTAPLVKWFEDVGATLAAG